MSKMQLNTTLGKLLNAYLDSPHLYLCDHVLFMYDPTLPRLNDNSGCNFKIDVIDVFLKAFPTRISTAHGRLDPSILEWCVDEDYLDSGCKGTSYF